LAIAPVGQNKARSERRHHLPALNAHRFRHDQRYLVAAGCADKRQRNTRITAGRLDDFHAGLEHPPLLGIPDHRGAYAAFHRIGGIPSFNFRERQHLTARHFAKLHQRRVANGQ